MTQVSNYRIISGNYSRLEETVHKLNVRCRRLHQPELVLAVTSKETVTYPDPITGFDKVKVYYHVTLRGEAPGVKGWSFVATLEHTPDGAILRTVPGQSIPTSYRNADPLNCDHCHTRRNRTQTYVLRSEANQYQQVGSNCLADFLGYADPHALAAYAELYALANEAAQAAEEEGEYSGGSGSRDYCHILTYLSFVSEVIRRDGWLSRSKAGYGQTSTADKAVWHMDPPADARKDAYVPSDASKQEAKDAVEFGRSYLDSKQADLETKGEFLSDYEHNLRIVIKSDALTTKGLGIAASLISWYQREKGYAAERKARAEQRLKDAVTACHVGTVGKREVFSLTLEGVRFIEGSYGCVTLNRFRDGKGNLLVWFQSGDGNLEVGSTYRIKGTVKAHEEYQGIPQTTITRCQVVEG
jgi:hypothetical protein